MRLFYEYLVEVAVSKPFEKRTSSGAFLYEYAIKS